MTAHRETSPPTLSRIERFETVVIGAGQAGLAVGYHLAARDADFVILSDETRVGDNWRKRWDSLRLFTPARHSGLPGMPFPAPSAHFPDKDEVGDYLERYAERHDLPLRLRTRVSRVSWNGNRYVISVDDPAVMIEADNVVIATGAHRRPRIPSIAARLATDLQQLHSSEYRNPFELAPGPVLVVGAGNSGAQIALELARFRKVWLSGRDTGHSPRRILGRDVFDWTWPVMRRATTDTAPGRWFRERMDRGGDALIGIAECELRGGGVTRVPRLESERGGLPVCGAHVLEPAVIVWCTGFSPDYAWLDLPDAIRADGQAAHQRGVSTTWDGLFFVGLRFQYRMSSSLIGGVGDDALFIADRLARRAIANIGPVAR